jgi:hypothetical protein
MKTTTARREPVIFGTFLKELVVVQPTATDSHWLVRPSRPSTAWHRGPS